MCARSGVSACWNIGGDSGAQGGLQLSSFWGLITRRRRRRMIVGGVDLASHSPEVVGIYALARWDRFDRKTEWDQSNRELDQWEGIKTFLRNRDRRTKRLDYSRRWRGVAFLHEWIKARWYTRVHIVLEQLSGEEKSFHKWGEGRRSSHIAGKYAVGDWEHFCYFGLEWV